MNNKTKLKVATIVLAGGLAVAGGVQYNKYLDSYDNQLKKEISNMSETQILDAIKECDIALESLQKKIDADETNAEERFDARRAHKSITEQRELLQERLDKLQKKPNNAIFFQDAMKIKE